MNTKSLVLAIATILFSSASFAANKVGDISCNVLTNSNLSISADIFGEITDEGVKPEFVNIQQTSYNRKTRATKVVKQWNQVPAAKSGFMSIAFENSAVRLEAYGDDVGAMSELRYEGKILQLQCEVATEE